MALLVERPGVFTTVQDQGRPGWRSWGVPPGGAFDRLSLDLANAILGNPPDAPALELTLIGGEFLAEIPMALAIVGAEMSARVVSPGGETRDLWAAREFSVRPGDRLHIGRASLGARAYLAVRGGWRLAEVLGSRSSESRLLAGTRLHAKPSATTGRTLLDPYRPDPTAGPIHLIDGPDDPSGTCTRWLERLEFRVSEHSDRMGIRLEGPDLPVEGEASRLSAPVVPGAIQVAGGQAILLGVAGGTMGGYPHVSQVISADLDRIGQARPGDRIRFARVSLTEARLLDRIRRSEIASWLKILRASALPDTCRTH